MWRNTITVSCEIWRKRTDLLENRRWYRSGAGGCMATAGDRAWVCHTARAAPSTAAAIEIAADIT